MLYDLSPSIGPALAVWPGDTPPERQVLMDLAKGDPFTLSTLRATVHLGSHADAPSHYGLQAQAIDRQALERYLGLCRLVRVAAPRGSTVGPEAIPDDLAEERVLFDTGTFPDPTRFNRDFAALSPALVDGLGRRGAKLVGIDAPSVDPFESEDLPSHAACLTNGIAILEGLVLGGVPEGVYELIALPLKLEGYDASPVRAVLRTP